MLQQDEPGRYVLATARSIPLLEFVERAFDHVGRAIAWRGTGVDETGVDASPDKSCRIDPRIPSEPRSTFCWAIPERRVKSSAAATRRAFRISFRRCTRGRQARCRVGEERANRHD